MSGTEIDFGPSPDGAGAISGTEIDFGPSGEGETIMDTEVTPRLVIAIDFGTYACGFSLQWRSDYEKANCLESIKVPTKWSSTGFCTRKTPSCILLKPDKSLAEFGYKADFLFSKNESVPAKKRPEDWDDWYFFRYFKMRLYVGEELTTDTPLEAANGKHLPVVEVLEKTIAYLKNEAISMLREDGVVYPEEETKWVLTVPAIWNDPAKHVMHEAAEKAGIIGKNLSIALEPECAAIYCTKLPLDKMDIACENAKPASIGSPGQTLMVVDMGGGTVDISTVRINDDKTMEQVSKSCGGPWGGTMVNEHFEMFLRNLIGEETMRTFVQKHAIDYYDLRMDFECRKREMKTSDDQIPIKLPESLRQLWERAEGGKEIDDILEDKKELGNIEFMSGRLFIDSSIIQKFFQDAIDGVLKHIRKDVFPAHSGIELNALILVGGFAESSYVVQCLRDGLKERNIPVVRPQLPELAVLNGAVLFGQNEKIVSSRIMRHTYGVAMTMDFVPQTHRDDEKYEHRGKLMANNVFRKHVTIGQAVNISEWISCKEYYPESEKDTKTTVYIFTSNNEDPIHTSDAGCEYIGQVDVKFGNDGDSRQKKTVTVEFNFGGTELKVRALTSTGNMTHVTYLKLQ